MKDSPASVPPPEEPPEVPLFRSWRALYLVVLGTLVIYIVVLAAWSRWFS